MAGSNVILIGYRGCGKSSVGRSVAARLGWTFVDTDELVAAAAGKSIRAIFEQDGETDFRRREAELVARVAHGTRQVISVGGGAVLLEENREVLRGAGVCIWLTAPAEELARRTVADPQSAAMRPALTDAGALEEIRDLLGHREPLYASLAEHVVPTAGQSVEQVTHAVLSVLAQGGASAEAP